jgi:hypothetical protein
MTGVKATKIGFKVVRLDVNGHYKSATFLGLVVCYKLLMPTLRCPEAQGPFALFATLHDAVSFYFNVYAADNDTTFKILLCEYVEASEYRLWYRKSNYSVSLALPSELCPPGTVFADTVTPLCEANCHDPDSLTLKNLKE